MKQNTLKGYLPTQLFQLTLLQSLYLTTLELSFDVFRALGTGNDYLGQQFPSQIGNVGALVELYDVNHFSLLIFLGI